MADLTKIHEEASGAYAILSSLTVSGDAVDAIASIRAKLRRVVELSAPEETEKKHG